MTASLTITRAEPREQALIEGLFQFYAYDFSEFQAGGLGRVRCSTRTRNSIPIRCWASTGATRPASRR